MILLLIVTLLCATACGVIIGFNVAVRTYRKDLVRIMTERQKLAVDEAGFKARNQMLRTTAEALFFIRRPDYVVVDAGGEQSN